MRRTAVITAAAVLLLAGTAAASPLGPGKAACTDKVDGGEWLGLNNDLHNTRNQPAEHTITAKTAPKLQKAWSFDGADLGLTGGSRSTPVVSGGCVYVAFGQGYLGDRGDVVALDAETGKVVWHTQLEGSVLGLSVANGLVYVTPSLGTRGDVAVPVVTDTYQPAGSYAVALDASTGARRWTSARLDDGNAHNGTFINSTPVAYTIAGQRLLFVTMAGGSGDGAKVPMYFLDALTGTTVKRSLSLTEAEYAQGFGGTGIWTTAAYDEQTGHLYAGTSDSDGKTRQHPYNDAILKIDADPRRATFGTVVDHYSGISEHADLDAVIGYPNNPACGAVPEEAGTDLPTFFDTSASVECLELDLDFGASPNLWTDSSGRTKVGDLQKVGVYHEVDTTTMTADWRFFVGPGGAAMDSGTATIDENGLHVGATPNAVFRLDPATGAVRSAGTTGVDLFAYQPLTSAGGVVYGLNDAGELLGLDATTELPVLVKDLASDGGFGNCLGVGAGVAVAQHTVFVPCDAGGTVALAGVPSNPGGMVAYRLP